ncbi:MULTISPECIES: NAD(P)H-dependent oxidoreductase [Acinetobacter calcoaceticus/baumannii complex]|uniref:NAD(P)H-dependent oxidoreductase n=1 Tax=Acinetobacter calcoaceticus/baumannii complex TaxID=909768 RepID=UPI00232DF1E1|nr:MULTISPECIES: NAD(P)H-dependent oxidoreductase [Acinetobacter calcoaceticus/baumannii complex]MDC4523921.1 NAD(P)H-dependent oxidoreductase [Acinetobacter baumannii]MDC4563403.1 NAD(P)H-dependent oxidoreductase [Acinetobacter baumannii]MDC4750289.1 NAD(P)H-dependent oxidoreductase [Acinetobacter baumannii]MDC5000621.1 NAD(P)H-dependent oxidoreductase [Acinetobacter baumannii]MDC5008161.1 NAD(P)H-dependent oxidoreductase [Acinetobacter baumannii]
MALLILAHPYYTQSIANKTIVNELIKTYPDLEVRDIFQLYPDYKIDVSAEQEALLRHDTIILQYPMFWFNMPAILKLWFDEVFTYQFAYGSQGDKLKDKKVIISMTVGQKEANMVNDQENLIDSFLKSVQHSIQYTQMQLSGTFLLYDVSPLSGNPESKIKLEAVEHSHKVLKHLTEA